MKIGLYINTKKTEFIEYDHEDEIKSLKGDNTKVAEDLIYWVVTSN